MSALVFPGGTSFRKVIFEPEERTCTVCGGRMYLCDHRHRRLYTLTGAVHVVSKLAHCPNKTCRASTRTISALSEGLLAPKRWRIGWDVFAWMGFRRFARHWSVPQIRAELADTFGVRLSDDAIEDYVARYEAMVAAYHADPARRAAQYAQVPDLVLTIDGLQPEKGHETLYVVRELRAGVVWFAESLLSSAAPEVLRLLERARDEAAALGKPVALWMTDKQSAFVSGIAEVFPGVPHRFCRNHFLRDVATPVLAADRHAKVTMRKKVRGLRAIERDVLARRASSSSTSEGTSTNADASTSTDVSTKENPTSTNARMNTEVLRVDEADAVVLDYCAAVRGILNDDQGGPLQPPGLRMAGALREVRASLVRCEATQKGGPRSTR